MNAGKVLIADDTLRVKLRLPRCGCEVHNVLAMRYVFFRDVGEVYLASQCETCKRIRLHYLSDINAAEIAGIANAELYVADGRRYYEQALLF